MNREINFGDKVIFNNKEYIVYGFVNNSCLINYGCDQTKTFKYDLEIQPKTWSEYPLTYLIDYENLKVGEYYMWVGVELTSPSMDNLSTIINKMREEIDGEILKEDRHFLFLKNLI